MAAEDFAGGGEVVARKFCGNGVDHVLAAGVGNDAADGFGVELLDSALVEECDGVGGEIGNGGSEEVAEFSVAVLEADFVAVRGVVMGVEAEAAKLSGLGRALPDGRSGAIAEETGADEDAKIIVEVEGGGAHFDGDTRDDGLRVAGENAIDGAEGGDGGAATESSKVLEVSIGAKAELLGHVAGHAGTKVTGTGADDQGIDFWGGDSGSIEGGLERGSGEGGGGATKLGIEFVRIHLKNTRESGDGKLPRIDAGVAVQDRAQGELATTIEGGASSVGAQHFFPTLSLGERLGRIGRGDALEVHE